MRQREQSLVSPALFFCPRASILMLADRQRALSETDLQSVRPLYERDPIHFKCNPPSWRILSNGFPREPSRYSPPGGLHRARVSSASRYQLANDQSLSLSSLFRKREREEALSGAGMLSLSLSLSLPPRSARNPPEFFPSSSLCSHETRSRLMPCSVLSFSLSPLSASLFALLYFRTLEKLPEPSPG